MTKELPSPETLRKLLRCDHSAGKLFWRERMADMFNEGAYTSEHICANWNSRWAGKAAFTTVHGYGYLTGSIFGKPYLAHRIIWAIVHGAWPIGHIDHINHDPADNRITNLRVVSHRENCRNASLSKSNKSGHTGVHWYKPTGKWAAKIMVDGKNKHLGYFDDKDEAIYARASANAKYKYHANHGDTTQGNNK